MRALLLLPLVLGVVAGLGWAVCRALGVDPATGSMVAALATAVMAGILAAVPLVLVRGSAQLAVSQAGLIATVLHLMVMIGGGGAVFLLLKPPQAFVLWLSAMYFASLIVLASAAVLAVRVAPPEPSPSKPPIETK